MLAQSTSVQVTVLNQQDTTLGEAGRLQTFISTSFQLSQFDHTFLQQYGTGLLAGLYPHHVRIQLFPTETSPGQWDFSFLGPTLASILTVADNSPEIELLPPIYMTDANGQVLPSHYSDYQDYCVRMVEYCNKGGFDANGVHYQSPSSSPVPWFGILNEPDLTGMNGTQYAALYNLVVPAMLQVDPTIKIVAAELSWGNSGFATDFGQAVTAQTDAFAFHYYPEGCSFLTDAFLMNDIQAKIAGDVQAVASALAKSNSRLVDLPVWMTEAAISWAWGSGPCNGQTFTPDPRTTSAFLPAWESFLFSQLAKAGALALHHWDFNAGTQFGEVNDATAVPYPAYFVDSLLSYYFAQAPPPGPMILKITNSGPGAVEALAIENSDSSVALMLSNFLPKSATDINGSGLPVSVNLNLSALGSFGSATAVTLDANTNYTTGPVLQNLQLPLQTTQLNGYGVTFIRLQRGPSVTSVSPINGSGSPQTFTATFASAAGASDLSEAHLYFGPSLSGSGACWMYYVHEDNSMYLVNDAGNGLVSGVIHPGASGTVSNSQCSLSNAGAAVSSGASLSVPVNIAFSSGFGGIRSVWAYAMNNEGLNSGWVQEGTWLSVTPVPPTIVSVTPVNGSGSTQTFTATYVSTAGATDLAETHLYIGPQALTASGACWIYYVRASNAMYLINDAGSGLSSGVIHPGSAGTISNGQCAIANAGAVTASGTNLAVPVAVTFAPGFAGTQDIFALAVGHEGLNSNWVFKGTWMPVAPTNPTVVSVSPINSSGSPQTFMAAYASNASASDIGDVYLYFGAGAVSYAQACIAYYVHSSNSLYLIDDAGNGLVSGLIHPGTSGTLANTQCTIGNAGAVSLSGNNLTLTVSVTFATGFRGAKSVYGFTTDNEGLTSGWTFKGTWQ